MQLDFLIRGLVIGISIAAPVGPIGIICIRRSLSNGQLAGFISGLGAATADAFYGCIAGFGLTIISAVMEEQYFWIRLAGGIFLCFLGIRTFLKKPVQEGVAIKKSRFLGLYISTLFLTLTNPMTIIAFTAIFAGLGIGSTGGDYISASTVVVGVFFGSALWWFTLSIVVSILRKGSSENGLSWVNRAAGMMIFGFGVFALTGVVR
jgi:threonine/homoserine/homoserine lactone efflux protein